MSTVLEPGLDARQRILQAAERLFAEKGFAATSVQEITEAAEVNKALLYYYFEDKHTLYTTLLDNGVTEFRRMLHGALDSPGTYPERLAVFIREHISLAWRRSTLLQMVHRCLMAGEGDGVALNEKFQDNLDRLTAFFADGMAAGEFRATDPEMLARSVLGLDNSFILCKLYKGEEHGIDRVADHVTDLLVHALAPRQA